MHRVKHTLSFFTPILQPGSELENSGRRSNSTGLETFSASRSASVEPTVSLALESPSPVLAPLKQTIKEYFMVYCEPNLLKLCLTIGEGQAEKLIANIQSVGSTEELDNHLKPLTLINLQTICRVFHRLLTGTLLKKDSIIQYLSSVDPGANLPELNSLVSADMKLYTGVFFNLMRTRQTTTPTGQTNNSSSPTSGIGP